MLAPGILLAVVPPALMHFLASEQVAWGGIAHTVFVGASAGAATVAAVVLTLAAARRGDGRSVMVGTAFAVMASLLVLHGLATPGVLFDDYGVVAFSGAATIPVGGALLAACTLPVLRGPRAVRSRRPAAALAVGLALYGLVGWPAFRTYRLTR